MKVLIVDDDVVSRKKLDWLVKSFGYETLHAENGQIALDLWRNEQPRFVITDWMMPVMNGLDLCKEIRKREGAQYTYIIIVTSRGNKDDVVTGLDSGADNYITKPFLKNELAAKMGSGRRILDIELRDILIFSISRLVESRDPSTGHHLEKMRHYSKTIAEYFYAAGHLPNVVNPAFIDNIFLTSPLHDIGKVGIPDHILLKADRLDDHEFGIMKTHTLIGYETLIAAANMGVKADYLKMSAEIALSHHEKWDGTGYPYGLQGEEIPLAARIVALADVYDALVSKRVYKSAYPHDTARAIIIREKGLHFDPLVVEAFLACENEFIAIFNRYKNQAV